jgi:8-oxo-dGTP pyrophosphatase MutT (NUDIX family)
MLDLKADRAPQPPKPAATLLLLRDGEQGPEIFCVERNKASRFLGGALVFPGGKVDPQDDDTAFLALSRGLPISRDGFADDDVHLRALAVAALRESLEEAAILPIAEGRATHEVLLSLRAELPAISFADMLARERLVMDLAALRPFARWVTPEAEARRYDTRFFICRAPEGQLGAHDDGETTASFWATPRGVLGRFERDEVKLAPPTHRCLELLCDAKDVDAALAASDGSDLRPICPLLVTQTDEDGTSTMALVLPGDPEHSLAEARVRGLSRYVLRGGKFVPEAARRADRGLSPP